MGGFWNCCCETLPCGFNSQTTQGIVSQTISGDLVIVRDLDGETESGLQFVGNGTVVGFGTATFDDRAGAISGSGAGYELILQWVNSTSPTTGKIWMGIPGEYGVAFDFATSRIEHVLLATDGTIASVVRSRVTTITQFRQFRLSFERMLSSDMLHVYATTNNEKNLRDFVTAHEVAEMRTEDFPICFGLATTSVCPANYRPLSVIVACGGSYDCQLCAGLPTPANCNISDSIVTPQRTRPDGLIIDTQLLGENFLSLIDNPINNSLLAENGTYFNPDCIWSDSISFVVDILEEDEETIAYTECVEQFSLTLKYYSGSFPLPGCGGESGAAVGDNRNTTLAITANKFLLVASYSIRYGGASDFQDVHQGVYAIDSAMSCTGSMTFNLLYAGHESSDAVGSQICREPWIDHADWPGTLTVSLT